jgi:DNA-binding XRE family transcriptional regulator
MNGFRMREIRKRAGLLQREVALELALHYVTICNWERRNIELPKVYGEAFDRLANDAERVYFIKSTRHAVRRERRHTSIGGKHV